MTLRLVRDIDDGIAADALLEVCEERGRLATAVAEYLKDNPMAGLRLKKTKTVIELLAEFPLSELRQLAANLGVQMGGAFHGGPLVHSDEVVATVGPAFRLLQGSAQARALPWSELATQTRLSVAILARLDRRLVLPWTVPDHAATLIGEAIGYPPSFIRAYLTMVPTVDERSATRLRVRQQVRQRVSFFDLVRVDSEMPDVDRRFWLGFVEREERRGA